MKCPKCGYNSFEHQESCKKCGQGLAEHKSKFNLRGFFSAGQAAAPQAIQAALAGQAAPEDYDDLEPPEDGPVDFGFDFLDEEDAPDDNTAIALDADTDGIDIDQPFGVDSETVPTDPPSSGGKNSKGSEFAF